jgi:DinB superfamily
MNFRIVALINVVAATALHAQQPAPPPSAAAAVKAAYTRIKTNFQKAAEKMPEENYGFAAAPGVETFGQRVAHIADPQLGTCSGLTGERKTGTAKSKTAKADLVAALSESFTACDKAFDALTDANALEVVTAGRGQQARIAVLYGIVIHANEVYGAMGVYMRIKGIVPPSSEGR